MLSDGLLSSKVLILLNLNESLLMLKSRIKYITLLALIANLVLISFQVHWLHNNYLIKKEEFKKSIRDGLEEALENISIGKMKSTLFPTNPPLRQTGISTDTIGTKIFPIVKILSSVNTPSALDINDIITNQTSGTIMLSIDENVSSLQMKNIFQDNENQGVTPQAIEIENFVSKVVVSLQNNRVDLKELDIAFKSQLEKRSLNTPFELELYRRDTLRKKYSSFDSFKPVYTLTTKTTFLSPNHTVSVHLPRQTLFLLKEMSVSLAISFLIIMIMLASFFYMLTIIFKQKQLAEIKNDFINNMTHELKTPISILSTANEALFHFKGFEDKNKRTRYLNVFQKELDRLTEMVEKVLNIAIYEKDRFTIEKEEVDLNLMLQDIVRAISTTKGKTN